MAEAVNQEFETRVLRVHYESNHNITVNSEDEWTVQWPKGLDPESREGSALMSEYWQEAVNEYMADTSVDLGEIADADLRVQVPGVRSARRGRRDNGRDRQR